MIKTSLTLFLALVASLVASPVTASNSSDLDLARAREMTRLVEDVLIDAELRSLDLGTSSGLSFDAAAVTWSNRNGLFGIDDARRLFNTRDTVSLGAFQDEPSPAEGDAKLADKSDKTGTNPINFTFDFRVYNEYLWLNTAGDGSQNLTTVEFRAPFADGKWQFRVRARANWIEADVNDDGTDDLDDSGFGDLDVRFLTVPYVNPEKRIAIAVGLEFSWTQLRTKPLVPDRHPWGHRSFSFSSNPSAWILICSRPPISTSSA